VFNADPSVWSTFGTASDNSKIPAISQNSITTGLGTTVSAYRSGCIVFQLETPLISPSAAGISVVVTIRGGSEFSVNVPCEQVAQNQDFFATASFTTNAPNTSIVQKCLLVPKMFDAVAPEMQFFGETIPSLRLLLKRYTMEVNLPFISTNTANTNFANQILFSWPLGPMVVAQAGTAAVAHVYPLTPSYVYKNTLLSYISAPFMGWRGSIRVKIVPVTSYPYTSFVSRSVGPPNIAPTTQIANQTAPALAVNDATTAANYQKLRLYMHFALGWTGTVVATGKEIIEFTMTHASNSLFHPMGNATTSSYIDKPWFNLFMMYTANPITVNTCNDTITIFKAAGDDYSVYGWLGCPDVVATAITPTYPPTAFTYTAV